MGKNIFFIIVFMVFIWFVSINIIIFRLGTSLDTLETAFNRVCSYLMSVRLTPQNPNKPFMIPNYCRQSSLPLLPNQSAYIPFIYKDEKSIGGVYRIDKTNKPKTSYFDMTEIYKEE